MTEAIGPNGVLHGLEAELTFKAKISVKSIGTQIFTNFVSECATYKDALTALDMNREDDICSAVDPSHGPNGSAQWKEKLSRRKTYRKKINRSKVFFLATRYLIPLVTSNDRDVMIASVLLVENKILNGKNILNIENAYSDYANLCKNYERQIIIAQKNVRGERNTRMSSTESSRIATAKLNAYNEASEFTLYSTLRILYNGDNVPSVFPHLKITYIYIYLMEMLSCVLPSDFGKKAFQKIIMMSSEDARSSQILHSRRRCYKSSIPTTRLRLSMNL